VLQRRGTRSGKDTLSHASYLRPPHLNVWIEDLAFRQPGVAINDYDPRSCSLQKSSLHPAQPPNISNEPGLLSGAPAPTDRIHTCWPGTAAGPTTNKTLLIVSND
jgi:hypothetical protein